MTTWIVCPGCGLKHSARPDGLCPRCRTRTGEPSAQSLPPPSASSAPQTFGEPLPTRPVPPAQPLPTTPVARGGAAAVTVGTLVSRTFSVWWANVGKFTAMLLLVYLPIFVFGALGAGAAVALRGRSAAGLQPGIVAGMVVLLLVMSVLMLIILGGLTFGALQQLAGRPVTFGAMLRAGARRAWPLFVVGLAVSLLVLLGMIALIVPGIIIGIGLALSYPIVMAEPPGSVGETIKRSFALTKGSRGTIFGAFLVIFVATWAASLVGNAVTAALKSSTPAMIVAMLASVLVQASLSVLSYVLCAVAYHELRLAKEGVDTSTLAQVFE